MRALRLPLLVSSLLVAACGGRVDPQSDAPANDAAPDAVGPSSPQPASYAHACAVDADCVLVTTPRSCASVVCGCPDGALAISDVARWQADVDAWKAVCRATVPQQPCGDLCMPARAFCTAGACEARTCLDTACSPPDAGPPDAPACFTDAVTADFERCQTDADCVVKHHQTDCCGTEVAVGVAASVATAYENCEHAWDAHFPGCGCSSRPLTTEDGKTVTDPARIAVRCISASGGGVCKTSMP